MEKVQSAQPDVFTVRHRFIERQKIINNPGQAKQLARKISALIEQNKLDQLRELLAQYYPPDLVEIVDILNDEQDKALFDQLGPVESADLLDELDDCTRETLARSVSPERLARIIATLPADEAANILRDIPDKGEVDEVLALLHPDFAKDISFLLGFNKETAGGIMSLGYVEVQDTATVGEAIESFRQAQGLESIFSIYVVNSAGALVGAADLHHLMAENPDRPISEVMTTEVVSIPTDMDQEDVAKIFARYDMNSLPVISGAQKGRLVGVVTADDIIDVIEAEFTQDILRLAGSDAMEMERTSPARIALRRLPWIMATMFIELFAGFVIRFYNPTLAKVLLLASFMPIISAISGNTGLQSATIIVRGLSAGSVRVDEMLHAVLRQLTMTVILGAATGLTLGIIGALWYGKLAFGLVIFLGMFIAVNIAGVVGTVVPLTSKRLGFDPAITSGPFETAFQDVVGISIFLTLATLMLPLMVK